MFKETYEGGELLLFHKQYLSTLKSAIHLGGREFHKSALKINFNFHQSSAEKISNVVSCSLEKKFAIFTNVSQEKIENFVSQP